MAATGHSAVILDDAVLTRGTGSFENNYQLRLTQSIQLRGLGLFEIRIVRDQTDFSLFQFTAIGIAELMALYTAPFGTEMNAAYVTSHTQLAGNGGPPYSGTATIPVGGSRYFSYWDGFFPPPTDTDNYGWILISNQAGVLSAQSGVTALSSGIIVGTTTQVPEASSLFLASLAGLGFFARRRR